mgnify:CR=1 FL=1
MSDAEEGRLERLTGMLKRRGIILPAFEIHGGAKGLYDFGPVGGRLRNKVNQAWLNHWISLGNIVEIIFLKIFYQKKCLIIIFPYYQINSKCKKIKF